MRYFVLSILKFFNFNFHMRNPWTDDILFLNSFMHKGYWFYRKKREYKTMMIFKEIIKKNFNIIEVGAHIGFVSQFLSKLVGKKGRVFLFEPALNNLKYLKKNILKKENIKLFKIAASNKAGVQFFYDEYLTGQNSSLVKNFYRYQKNLRNSIKVSKVRKYKVQTNKLDNILIDQKIDFIKIDVEGHELEVLLGSLKLIKKNKPMFMVEIQSNKKKIWNFFNYHGYIAFNENKKIINHYNSFETNNFFIHKNSNQLKMFLR